MNRPCHLLHTNTMNPYITDYAPLPHLNLYTAAIGMVDFTVTDFYIFESSVRKGADTHPCPTGGYHAPANPYVLGISIQHNGIIPAIQLTPINMYPLIFRKMQAVRIIIFPVINLHSANYDIFALFYQNSSLDIRLRKRIRKAPFALKPKISAMC